MSETPERMGSWFTCLENHETWGTPISLDRGHPPPASRREAGKILPFYRSHLESPKRSAQMSNSNATATRKITAPSTSLTVTLPSGSRFSRIDEDCRGCLVPRAALPCQTTVFSRNAVSSLLLMAARKPRINGDFTIGSERRHCTPLVLLPVSHQCKPTQRHFQPPTPPRFSPTVGEPILWNTCPRL